jgi:hypothetical protein
MTRIERLGRWSAANWFLPAAAVLLTIALVIARATPWASQGAAMEAVFLFDVCITLPLLYALCYARTLPPWQLALRMLGVACLGIFLLDYMVPPEARRLLPAFHWARSIGLLLLVLFELRLVVAGIRLVFRPGTTEEQLSASTGAPPFIARLMLLEARFWQAVWRFFRR